MEQPEVDVFEGITKCDHGNVILKGDAYARYCSGCNPSSNRILAPMRRTPEVARPERTIDTTEYMDAPIWERMADAERMSTLEV